ncbi:class I SAM-dependent methyltransferase [Desulfocicer niacini]
MAELLLEQVGTYWTGRATGYSQGNVEELNSARSSAWKRLIKNYMPRGRGLKVLDVGTGPGFLALIMAGWNHCVTAVDYTQAMIEQARENGARFGHEISFTRMDAQSLDFEDQSFDLLITRNLTWNLEMPEKAYREFFRVLRPGGRLLNFDANWYLHLFDPDAKKAWDRDRQKTKKRSYPDHFSQAYARTMESIAKKLPLSRKCRPEWDTRVLKETGFTKLLIEFDIGKHVWDEVQKVNFASTPMFMIGAEK